MSEPFGTDRRALSQAQPPKEQRFPRTDRRMSRIRNVIGQRQPDLTVVLENVHDPHNIAAVLRSCDAVGILRIHLVYTREAFPELSFSRRISSGAAKWVGHQRYDSIDACYRAVRDEGCRILATAGAEDSVSLFDADLCMPSALVFGNEMRGLSSEAIALADVPIEIPMSGMVRSLNVSVACAVCLYEAYRQRISAGLYASSRLDPTLRDQIEADWIDR